MIRVWGRCARSGGGPEGGSRAPVVRRGGWSQVNDANDSAAGPAVSVDRAEPDSGAGSQAASGTEAAEAVEETEYEEAVENEEEDEDEEEEAISPEALADLCGKCKGLC